MSKQTPNKPVVHIHIPRTAGTSLDDWAKRNIKGYQRCSRAKRGKRFDPNAQWTYTQHLLRRSDDVVFQALPPDWLSTQIKIGAVRNTWQRLASQWSYEITRPWRVADPDNREWQWLKTFDTFIHSIVNDEGFYAGKRLTVGWIFRHGIDFVLRHDHLNEDHERLCVMLGLDYTPIKHHRRRQRANKSYRDLYTPKIRELVGDYFGEEIEQYKFRFKDVP